MADDDFDIDLDFDFGDFSSPEPTPSPIPAPEPIVQPVVEPVNLADDTAVDNAFASIVDGIENDEEVQRAAALIMEAEAAVAAEEKRLAALAEARREHERKIKEMEQALLAVRREADAIREAEWDAGAKMRRERQRKREAEIQKNVAENAAKSRQTIKSRARRFQEIMESAPWYKGLDNGFKILGHQIEGAKFLANARRAILGDGMGVGKTLTSIAALDLAESKRALVITPADLTSNFTQEIRMWAPHRPVIDIHGMTKFERNTALEMVDMLDSVVVVVNYEAWRKDSSLLTRLGDLCFDTIIMDEAHSIKTTSSDAYKGTGDIILADNICPVCEDRTRLVSVMGNSMRRCPVCKWSGQSFYMEDERGVALSREERYWVTKSVKNLWTMTGTAILNKPQDIFGQLSLIDPHTFDNKNSFLRTYCIQDEKGNYVFGVGGQQALLQRLHGRYLARTMEDAGVVLPPQKPIEYELNLDPYDYPQQSKIIKQLSEHSQIVMSDGRSMPILYQIALITRQRQANVYPGGIEAKDPMTGEVAWRVAEEVNESIKIDKVVDLVDEYVGQEKKRMVVFSQFKTGLAEAERRLKDKGYRVVRFDGDTSDALKEEVKQNFNKSKGEVPKWDIVLANYKTGGVGLNLTACEHTVIMDEEWNPGKRDQAYARTRRIGQDQETFVHILRIPNTVDTWLANLIADKEDMIAGFTEDAKVMQDMYLEALRNGEA